MYIKYLWVFLFAFILSGVSGGAWAKLPDRLEITSVARTSESWAVNASEIYENGAEPEWNKYDAGTFIAINYRLHGLVTTAGEKFCARASIWQGDTVQFELRGEIVLVDGESYYKPGVSDPYWAVTLLLESVPPGDLKVMVEMLDSGAACPSGDSAWPADAMKAEAAVTLPAEGQPVMTSSTPGYPPGGGGGTPQPVTGAASPVPTMGEVGVLLSGLALAGAAAPALRRRREQQEREQRKRV